MKKLLFWGVLAALVVLSLLPSSYLGAPVFNWWDKAQHALGFAFLTLLAFWAYPARQRLRTSLELLALGAAIELLQAGTGWRMGEWPDLLADAVGIGAANALCWSLFRAPRRAA